MIDVTDVLNYVGGTDTDYAQSCLDSATDLVAGYIGSSVVPENIEDRAILETASELYHRKNAPSGIQAFAYDGAPAVRLNRDPMAQSYAALDKFVVRL
jgi:hypothetical protein